MKYANVNQPFPGPNAKNIIEHDKKIIPNFHYRMHNNLVIEYARGSLVYDYDKNTFIDILTGASVSSIGYCHPKVSQAIKEQAKKYGHVNQHVLVDPLASEYYELLLSNAPGELKNGGIYMGNSGAEAVEAALKFSFYLTKGRSTIIAFEPCFHGRTLGAVSLTTGSYGKKYLGTAMQKVEYAPYGDADAVEDILKYRTSPENVAAIIFEPIAGEPGIIIPEDNFYKKIREICDKHNIMMIDDEVQMGFGKTGKYWAIEHSNITPDIMTFGKPAGGGLPLGGIICKKELAEQIPYGYHASTFGGNPYSLAAGIATMEVIQENNLVERSKNIGKKLLDLIDERFDYDIVKEKRGKGMIIGIELEKDNKPAAEYAKAIIEDSLNKGLIGNVTGKNKNVIRLTPALNIPEDMLYEAIDILDSSFKDVIKNGIQKKLFKD